MDMNTTVLVDTLRFPECPRWHEGTLWCSDFFARRVIQVDLHGQVQTVAQLEDMPGGLGWTPQGRLLATFEQEGSDVANRALRVDASFARTQEIQTLFPTSTEAQAQGAEPLSRQEQRVLRLLVAGQTYAEIAEALIVSPNTVKTQVSSIYRKLGVSRRAEAIAKTSRLHLLSSK